MWERTYSTVCQGVSKEVIWRLWTDVNNWSSWHGDLEYCKLEGAFEVGNYFMLKPKGVKAVKIRLTEVDEGRSFTDRTDFFGAQMYDTHTIEEIPDGLLLTNRVVVTGPLKWLWVKLVGQNVANTVPEDMQKLIKMAMNAHG
jgi:hypothetical protein